MSKAKQGPVRHMNRCPIHGVYPAPSAMVPCPLCQKAGHAASTVEGPPARRVTTPPRRPVPYFPSFQAIAEIVGQPVTLPRAYPGAVYFPRIDLEQLSPEQCAEINDYEPTVPCAHCGEPVPLRAHYCNTSCRQKAYRRRKKSG